MLIALEDVYLYRPKGIEFNVQHFQTHSQTIVNVCAVVIKV